MGWKPADFWYATSHELYTAMDGYALAQGSDDAQQEDREEQFAEFLRGLEAAGVA